MLEQVPISPKNKLERTEKFPDNNFTIELFPSTINNNLEENESSRTNDSNSSLNSPRIQDN